METTGNSDKEILEWLECRDWDYVAQSDIPKFAEKWGVSTEKMWQLVRRISHI